MTCNTHGGPGGSIKAFTPDFLERYKLKPYGGPGIARISPPRLTNYWACHWLYSEDSNNSDFQSETFNLIRRC